MIDDLRGSARQDELNQEIYDRFSELPFPYDDIVIKNVLFQKFGVQ